MQKKRNSDRELWRQSWGSAHSQSSCSVHSSNAAASSMAGLSQSGKDEFWAALQTNYNYIMDTNLLDTCKEARGELLDGGRDDDALAAASAQVALKARGKGQQTNDDGAEESCDDCAKVRVEYHFILVKNNSLMRSRVLVVFIPS